MKVFFKKHIKLCMTVLLVIAFFVIYLFDFCVAQTYHFEIVSVSPEIVYADPKIPVEISVKLTRHGKGVAGHDLYMLPVGENAAGVFKQNRIRTDENGTALFTYYPYKSTMFVPAAPVNIELIDESNSVIFVINAKHNFVLDLQECP